MQTNQNTSTNKAPISGCISTSKIMFELWERNANNLTKELLEWFADATECASILSQDLQNVLDGIGCLISEDGKTKTNAGNFQSRDDVPTCYFSLAGLLIISRA